MNRMIRPLLCAIALLGIVRPVAGQEPPADAKLRVFIDCSYYCDMDYMRTELNWVEYMRDRADAQVHVLVVRETTGGGGSRYTLEFIGLRDFEGKADTLNHVATADATGDQLRQGLTRVIKMGLVPYVADTPIGRTLDITVGPPRGGNSGPGGPPPPGAPGTQNDPWKFWTFTIGLNGNASGESQATYGYLSGNLTANRVTADWKVNLRSSGSYNEQKFSYVIDDEEIETLSIRRTYSASALIVKSIGPHLSFGGRLNASSSTVGNTSLTFSLSPAIEYNFVPYSESTRRSLIVQYSAGARYSDYRELTIFDQVEETRPVHTLSLGYATRQPWGSISVSLDGSQYLHDTGKYNAGINGSTSMRLFRGFSFNLSGGYTHVRDQLALAKRDLTEEEILLRQRLLATAYNYYAYFGISYRFGSIFNTVVNPRFGGVNSEGIIIF
jgi:hypothetical protein